MSVVNTQIDRFVHSPYQLQRADVAPNFVSSAAASRRRRPHPRCPDAAGHPRSYNEKMLCQIRALQLGKALDDVAMYKIGSRELTKLTIAKLTKWEADFERRVRTSESAAASSCP